MFLWLQTGIDLDEQVYLVSGYLVEYLGMVQLINGLNGGQIG